MNAKHILVVAKWHALWVYISSLARTSDVVCCWGSSELLSLRGNGRREPRVRAKPGRTVLRCGLVWWIKARCSHQQEEHSPGCVPWWLLDRCWIEWPPGRGTSSARHAHGSLGLPRPTGTRMSLPTDWPGRRAGFFLFGRWCPGQVQRGHSAHCHLSKVLWSGDSCPH